MNLTAFQCEALRLLGSYTAGRCDPWDLAGPAKATCRAHILSALRGVKVPKSKATVTTLREGMTEILPYEPGDCTATWVDKIRRLVLTVRPA